MRLNESGTDVTASVPDLYKLIKGRQKWRAVIVDTEPALGERTVLCRMRKILLTILVRRRIPKCRGQAGFRSCG